MYLLLDMLMFSYGKFHIFPQISRQEQVSFLSMSSLSQMPEDIDKQDTRYIIAG